MKKRFLSLLSALFLAVLLLPTAVSAADVGWLPEEYSNLITSALPPASAEKRTSFLGELPGGGYQVLIYHDGSLYVENFDAQWNCVNTQKLELELPLWGGAFLGEKYNYVICGNYADSSLTNGGEVYRVIQYDKGFERIASLPVFSSETDTYSPFADCAVSFAEQENHLAIVTAHKTLESSLTTVSLLIDTDNMTWVQDFSCSTISDPRRHFVAFDGDTAVRTVLNDDAILVTFGDTNIPLETKSGHRSDLAGLAVSSTHYLLVGTNIDFKEQNIYLYSIDKETGQTNSFRLTASTSFDSMGLCTPKITKISDDRFVVMWNSMARRYVQYVILDGAGNVLCSQKECFDLQLTDCDPICSQNKIIWPNIYDGTMSIQSLTDLTLSGVFEHLNLLVASSDSWDGTTDTNWYSSEKTNFYISTPEQFAGLSKLAEDGITFAGQTVHLMADIFMNPSSTDEITYAHEWTPIPHWEGTLNGNGHTIYNLYLRDWIDTGIIDIIGKTGVVKALEITQGSFYAGGCIAHRNDGIVAMCTNRSYISDRNSAWTGMICGQNTGLIYGCRNYGRFEVSSNTQGGNGGIVGFNSENTATVSQCSNMGTIVSEQAAAGIVGRNHGWVYNCRSTGLLAQAPFSSGKFLCGIVMKSNISISAKHITNCYSLSRYSYNALSSTDNGCLLVSRLYSIAWSDVQNSNCYTRADAPSVEHDGILISAQEMRSQSFVDLLNQQTNTVLPAWVADTDNINNGYPITVAEQNYARGIYKIQPELWMNFHGNKTMHTGDSASSSCKTYFTESELVITVADPDIVSFSLEDDDLEITALSPGETYLNFHLDETENAVAVDYQLKIVVTPDHEWVNGECTCGAEAIEVDGYGDTLEIFIPGLPEGTHIVSAFYNSDGKMVTCFIDSPSNETIIHHDSRIEARNAQYCYVYILDENWSPLMDPIFERV